MLNHFDAGWWFGTFGLCFHIFGNNAPNWRIPSFFKMVIAPPTSACWCRARVPSRRRDISVPSSIAIPRRSCCQMWWRSTRLRVPVAKSPNWQRCASSMMTKGLGFWVVAAALYMLSQVIILIFFGFKPLTSGSRGLWLLIITYCNQHVNDTREKCNLGGFGNCFMIFKDQNPLWQSLPTSQQF